MPAAKKPTATSIMKVVVPGGVNVQLPGDAYPIFLAEGELVRGSHPAVKHQPAWFEPIEAFDQPEVKAATAAPGEKRGA